MCVILCVFIIVRKRRDWERRTVVPLTKRTATKTKNKALEMAICKRSIRPKTDLETRKLSVRDRWELMMMLLGELKCGIYRDGLVKIQFWSLNYSINTIFLKALSFIFIFCKSDMLIHENILFSPYIWQHFDIFLPVIVIR